MNTKLLRQKILDLAIRGKLTDQRKSDGSATDLLKEIAEAKRSLSQSKGKVSKNLGAIIPIDKVDAPFEIPENWEWVKLGDLCNASSGKTPSTSQKEFWNGNVLWVTSKDVKQKYIDSTQICLSDLGASSMQLYPPKTMIIVGRSGILRHTLPVAILKKNATINQDLKALVFKDNRVVEFIYAVIKGMEPHLLHEYKKAGTTVDNLNFDLFLTAPIPLPPLAEQQRIVAKIEEAFAEIDTVEKNKELLKTHIKQTRQKILDLAIHGKLVPQNENDEPASLLLEKILQEKVQTDNKKSPKKKKIDDIATSDNRPYEKIEDIPFEIPESWMWVRLNDIALDMADGPKEARIIQLSNIAENGWRDENVRYTTFEHAQKNISRSVVKAGNLVIAKMMPAGRTMICPSLEKMYVLSSDAVKLVPIDQINKKYLCYSMNSPYFREQVNGNIQGTTRLRTSISKLKECLLAFPPLNEQSRIVSKIEELFFTLDQMEKILI